MLLIDSDEDQSINRALTSSAAVHSPLPSSYTLHSACASEQLASLAWLLAPHLDGVPRRSAADRWTPEETRGPSRSCRRLESIVTHYVGQ